LTPLPFAGVIRGEEEEGGDVYFTYNYALLI
jgi:hypothetical protein